MDPEEQELLSDYRYRSYSSVIEKALRNFESSSEWADLISSLGKLNKALQSNLKYSLLPRRLLISKRLAQCLHPALPSGVHLKALETYEIIFKIVGTKWLAKDLFLYSCGLFPLLAYAAMSVRPVLLGLYEKYFLPLQKLLLPSLQAFLVGLLPGLEEGSEIYDRTDALLLRLSLVVGREVFYAALWGSVLTSPSIRLPASLFVVSHISRDSPCKEQKYMLGTDYQLTVKSLCASLLDANVLVQRNNLEIILFFFPFYTCLDPDERAIPLLRRDVIHILSAATQTLLRRDMSLNRRLYAWLLGSDIKGNTIVPESVISNSSEDQSSYFFEKYSKDVLVEALAEILHQQFLDTDVEERHHAYLKPFRILVSLLDKPEIGPQVVENLFLEVIRAFYSYCHDVLGSDLKLSYTQSGNLLASTIKENRHASEIVKTVNLLFSSLSTDFLWDYMARCFEKCFKPVKQPAAIGPPTTVSELCTLLVFLLDVIPLELYSEVQTQYLPQVLGCLLQPLAEEVEALSLAELTHALKTCFKVLSKVQMPPSYLDMEPSSENSSPVKGENSDVILDTKAVVAGDEEAAFPPLKSEDSGIGLSASSPELSEHLRVPRVSAERDDIWKRDGSMQRTFLCIQELIANFASKNIFAASLTVSGEEHKPEEPTEKSNKGQTPSISHSERKGSWDSKPITVPQFKQMLSDLFTARGSPFKMKSSESLSSVPSSPQRKAGTEWDIDQVVIELVGSREDCREAFAAACHLLLDCATFPVYLSEEETEQLCETLFQAPGANDCSFPSWLKSLMTICCCVNDCALQNIAIATLLEVINHSQSLALVIEDKMKRYKTSGNNPFFGKLQMVTVPPIAPGILKVIAEKTDFYQRVARVLWNQLNKETREHHITCVELFYRLHCLAPTANICEDIICHALLDPDKGTRLEALFRFSVIWHLTREIQGSRVTSHNRSFDRSLFVVLDSLACTDGAISAAAQGWLVRALSLGDVARILEPMLLLLLQPKTQRTSIHCLKRENSAEDVHRWLNRKKPPFKEACGVSELQEAASEERLPLGQFTTVDREAIWAEVEKEPERCPPRSDLSEEDLPYYMDLPDKMASGGPDSSEHTESADTSSGHTDSESTSPFSSPSHDLRDLSHEENCCAPIPISGRVYSKRAGLLAAFQPESAKSNAKLSLARADSDKTQASESLSSDEEADVELQAITTSRLLKQQREKQETLEALFKHILLYLQPYDSQRVLYAFSVLEAVLKTNPKEFIEAVSRTGIDTSSTAHLNLISNLLARHQEALVGQSFYGKLQTQAPNVCPHSLLIELLTYLCLSFLRSYYPCHLKVCHKDILGNRDVQVKSVEVLIRITTQLVSVAKSSEGKNVEFIHSLLQRCKVQEFVLLSLSASMYTSQKRYGLATADRGRALVEDSLFEESLINLGQDQIWSEHPLQIELLKLLQALIVLEHHLGQGQEDAQSQPALSREWQRALNFQQAIGAMQYVQPHPLTSQGLLVSAVVRGLQPAYGYGMHPAWVSLVTHSLPYFGKSLGWTVTPFVIQICKNLDELVKQYESESVKLSVSTTAKRENISPDYPLTLLEGLTTISHFCLLEQPTQHKKTATISDPINLRNAKNAILEELPRIVNTMALIWNVLRKEETQKRPVDLLGATKGSSSVYFKTTKIIRQKILDLLNPLTAHLGVQLIAAVATVWSRKQARRHSKMKIVPVASASQHTLVDLVCALSTLQTESVLQLVREVVKRPQQIKSDEKSPLVDIPVLQFCYAFIQRLSVPDLQENFPALLGVLKESVQLNLAPPGYFLLLSMLNDFVARTPNLESKKDQKDLQEITQKILEAVGTIAGSSLEQTSWLSRNLEVRAQPQVSLEESDADDDAQADAAAASAMVSASAPSVYSVQALSLLAEVLASLLDMVYRSDEKEKAVPLISRLLYYVFPYLRNHSAYNAPSFRAGAQLLSSLSGYAYTKRAWKKELLELFLDPTFFQMDTSCVHWKSIIDHLLTHEKTMFKDLMNMQSSSLKLFSSFEQKAMLLKRQAFAVFSGELDQYHLYLPLIQERLTDNLRVGQTSTVAAQMFLFFRVLLLRISPQHLISLWPIMVSELIQTFIQLEEDLKEEDESLRNSHKTNRVKVPVADGSGPSGGAVSPGDLVMYLSACKFLDTALSFPPDKMPLFQIYRWAFVPEVDTEHPAFPSELEENHQECRPHTVRILELLRSKYGETGSSDEITGESEFPLLRQHSVSSIRQLMPFFKTVNCAFKTQSHLPSEVPGMSVPEFPVAESPKVLRQLEECVEHDFLEHPEC
ncbi:protein dopey-2 isoform X2 [Alexandromys fortis]|uniref:protein dopey-2 isoform X2 n=1 Tax=Alexandromys fortis TaxID=100897 RepID=UPI0021533004|nr:protein dopey-2 isoform X2 [Microtus fortis]XP_050018015.1 protein dopey-2 isoform X2 [Microtus fortis]XP_050018016.1 protein dopey-2 isoform X2 [Microtus fortis]